MAENDEALSREIIEHMMNPKNYGKLEEPDGVGVGVDEQSGEYVIMYVCFETEQLSQIAFATNGCQDTVVLGSVFTEMVKATSREEAESIMISMEAKVAEAPPKQQACSALVLTAFKAALHHRDARLNGATDEMYQIPIAQSCDTEKAPA